MRSIRKQSLAMAVAVLLICLVAGCSNSGSKNKKANSSSSLPTPEVAQASAAPITAAATSAAPGATPGAGRGTNGTPAAAGRLACLDNLRTYRYNGQLALTLAAGATSSQIGALANLLNDVSFDGAYQAPDASTLNVKFPGADGSQDLQTIKSGGMFYQKTGSGGWQLSTGTGPIVGTLSQLDPQTLCDQTIAQIDASSITPAKETVNGVAALHYSFGPADLARSPGLFGGAGRDGNQGGPGDTQLDVWTSVKDGYPVRIALKSSFGETGGSSTLDVMIDISDINGSDVSIKAPI